MSYTITLNDSGCSSLLRSVSNYTQSMVGGCWWLTRKTPGSRPDTTRCTMLHISPLRPLFTPFTMHYLIIRRYIHPELRRAWFNTLQDKYKRGKRRQSSVRDGRPQDREHTSRKILLRMTIVD